MADIAALKAAVPFHDLVSETHDIGRNGKVLCPFHDDHNPSCHIYENGYKCFSCGAQGDAVNWLEAACDLSTAEAIRELESRAGGAVGATLPRSPVKVAKPAPIFKPVALELLEHHYRQAALLRRVPLVMEGRGFTLADLHKLGFRAERDDALFPVFGPNGTVLNIKCRKAYPKTKNDRYTGLKGHGSPAWCSPDFLNHNEVLVIEGELNAMACSLARPDLGVMGVAGNGGKPHLDTLKSRTVYVYADADEASQAARDKWAAQALEAGACKVYTLDPWPMDACDIAGRGCRLALLERLNRSLKDACSFSVVKSFDASATAPKNLRLPQQKSDLMFSDSGLSPEPRVGASPHIGRAVPVLGGKPCL